MNIDSQNQQSFEEKEEEKKNSKKGENDNSELSKEKTTHEEIYKKIEEEKDKFLRLFAEFENYKKRTQKERLDLFKTSHQEVIVSLIPVLDDFGRGISEITKSKDESLIQGIKLIQEKFLRILKDHGLQEIQTQKGDDFNTDIHEAVTQIPAISEELQGKIVKIVENGYSLRDKVIRHAKVIVGK